MRYLINKVVERVVVKEFDKYEDCDKFVSEHKGMELDSRDDKFMAVVKAERTIRR